MRKNFKYDELQGFNSHLSQDYHSALSQEVEVSNQDLPELLAARHINNNCLNEPLNSKHIDVS